MEKLRILFIGNSDFGVPTLENIVSNGWNVVSVLTNEPKWNVRKKVEEKTPVHESADKLNIPVITCGNDLTDATLIEQVKSCNADLAIVIAFRILPIELYTIPKMGTVNIHGSLLPDYRGAAPINWMIANGEELLGLTAFVLNDKVDTGEIIQEWAIPNFNYNFSGAYKILSESISPALTSDVLHRVVQYGYFETQKQDNTLAVHKAPKLSKENTKIDFSKDGVDVMNIINAFSEKPGAWCTIKSDDKFNGKSIKILTGVLALTAYVKKENVGKLTVDNTGGRTSLLLYVDGGAISITRLQLEGKKVMTYQDFINGFGSVIDNWTLV